MSKNLWKRLLNSSIILIILICIGGIGYYSYNVYILKVKKQSSNNIPSYLYHVSNESIKNMSAYRLCNLLEKELNDNHVGDVKDRWRCYSVYDYNTTKDVILNKTEGLCECFNILKNGQPIHIYIREAKNMSHQYY